jgi:hypothetical protein
LIEKLVKEQFESEEIELDKLAAPISSNLFFLLLNYMSKMKILNNAKKRNY